MVSVEICKFPELVALVNLKFVLVALVKVALVEDTIVCVITLNVEKSVDVGTANATEAKIKTPARIK